LIPTSVEVKHQNISVVVSTDHVRILAGRIRYLVVYLFRLGCQNVGRGKDTLPDLAFTWTLDNISFLVEQAPPQVKAEFTEAARLEKEEHARLFVSHWH
jgi:hypothetical protein